MKLNSKTFKDKLTATVKVKNAGKVAGKEVVQLYISAPAQNLDKPLYELKAFAKTKLLQPGASQTVSFVITPQDLASFDTERTSWIAEAGEYTLNFGSSSKDIKAKKTFQLPNELVVEKLHKALSPQVKINELKK